MKAHARFIDRRRFLRNAGVVIALPMMEMLIPRAIAQAAAKKPVKRFVCLSNNYGVYPQAFFPAQGGRDYEMSPTLKPLERHRASTIVCPIVCQTESAFRVKKMSPSWRMQRLPWERGGASTERRGLRTGTVPPSVKVGRLSNPSFGAGQVGKPVLLSCG